MTQIQIASSDHLLHDYWMKLNRVVSAFAILIAGGNMKPLVIRIHPQFRLKWYEIPRLRSE
jgi:hypothetical protein